MAFNPNKTVSANSRGIVISFRDVNKHRFFPYENLHVEEIQTKGKVSYQKVTTSTFNKVQQQLYAETVYGLSYYHEKDLKKMSKAKKQRVLSRYAKAQRILNRWKQEIVSETVDAFLLALFPNSKVTKALVETKGFDRQTHDSHSFKELGITQEDVAKKLIDVKLLPENFFQLC